MKKKLVFLMAAVCALILSLALVGCSNSSKNPAENFIGEWSLSGGTDMTAEDVEMLESLGLTVTLTLAEDETATLDMMGEAMEGTWEAKSDTKCAVTLEGESVDAVLADGELTMTQDGDELKFKKAEK